MAMTRNALKEAARLEEELQRAEKDLEAVFEMQIVGVSVNHPGSTSEPIPLRKDGLRDHMTAAFNDFFATRVADAKAALAAIGIDVIGD